MGSSGTPGSRGGRLIFRTSGGLLDLPMPNLPDRTRSSNAGRRWRRCGRWTQDEGACEMGVSRAEWPARMHGCGGSSPRSWGRGNCGSTAGTTRRRGRPSPRPCGGSRRPRTHLVCGMLNTKDVGGFMRPLAGGPRGFGRCPSRARPTRCPRRVTAAHAAEAGIAAEVAEGVAEAVAAATGMGAGRIVICGSLYLAGHVLRMGHDPSLPPPGAVVPARPCRAWCISAGPGRTATP
jgi:dihydrofolate synthase/folylpolyglutamate synthase